MKPLIKSIASLCFIAKPSPAFGDEAPMEAAPPEQAEKITDEVPPDYSFIEQSGDAPRQGAGSEPEKVEESAQGEPEKKEEVKPEPEKPEAVPAAPKEEAVKKEEPKPVVILPTDEEIEKLQPKPGASSKIVADFNVVKGHAKTAIKRVKELEAQYKVLEEKSKDTKLPPEIEERLKRADEDRRIAEMFELDNDPVLKTEFTTKLTKADDELFSLLIKHPRLALLEKSDDPKVITAETIRNAGLDTPEGKKYLGAILDRVGEMKDPLLLDEVKDAIKARNAVLKEKGARLETIRTNKDGYLKEREEAAKKEQTGWGQAFDQNLKSLIKPDKDGWVLTREVPATASDAEKKEIEAHNERITKEIVPKFHETIMAIWKRDPAKGSEAVYKSIHHDIIAKELEDLQTKHKTELDAANKRIEELTKTAAGIRRIGSAPNKENVQAEKDLNLPVGASAESSIDAFLAEKGIK